MFEDLIPAGDAGSNIATPTQYPGDDLNARPIKITVPKAPPEKNTIGNGGDEQAAPSSPALSERDRKLIIRTVLGEAAGEGDEGQRAVAAVILNRLRSGKFGGSIPQIVAAKNQFEPWMTPEGRTRMLGYSEQGPEYSRAAANIEAILSGGEADPTNGATHFFSPKAQAALGRKPPSWAQGQPLAIGNHNFYSPGAQPAAKPVQVASNDPGFVPQPAAATDQPAADPWAGFDLKPAAAPGGMFGDLVPKGAKSEPTATLAERFSGEGMGIPSDKAAELASGLRKSADTSLLEKAYGREPSQAEQTLDTVIEQLANTFLLNVPRNIGAAYLAHKYDLPFDDAYQRLKDVEEARARQNPKSAWAGFGGGLALGMATLPVIGGATTAGGKAALASGKAKDATTIVGRARQAGLTGATYGATAELLDSKDPITASVAAALGGVLGGVASPVAEKIVGLVSKFVSAGKTASTFLKSDGTLSDEAIAAAKEAGIDVATLQKVMQAKYAETFGKKGASPATAREAAADEFGIKLSPGEATGDYGKIAREQSMARDTEGPIAGNVARNFFEEQNQSVVRAKTGVQKRIAGNEPLVDNVNDAANQVGEAVRGKASDAKRQFKGAYKGALNREGEFSDIAFRDIGERIRREGLKAPEPVIIDDVTTPVAARAIQHLDATIGKVKIQDRAEPRSMEPVTAGRHQWPGEPKRLADAGGANTETKASWREFVGARMGEYMRSEGSHGAAMKRISAEWKDYQIKSGATATPAADTIAGVNLRGVDQARKQLVAFYKAAKSSGNDSDIRAMQRIIAGFDDELETSMTVGLFKGDEQALPALKEARRLFLNYQKTFRSQRPGDDVGRAMEKIVERNATGGEIGNYLLGKSAIGEKGDSVRLAGRLKGLLDPQDWNAVRQGLWLRLTSKPEGVTDFGPQALSERIFKFVNGDGADMAKVMFTPKELGEMRRFATVLKSIVPPKGTVNYSGTGYELARQMLAGTGIGAGAFWLTEDPVTSAALAAGKVGSRLGKIMYKGRAASKYFKSGAPKVPRASTIDASGGAGVASGLAAGQAQ